MSGRRKRVVRHARQMAQVLRRTGEQMREQGEGQQVAGVADSAAERIERLGGYLERTSGEEFLRDAEDFARQRPSMVAGPGANGRPGGFPFPESVVRAPLRLGPGQPFKRTAMATNIGVASTARREWRRRGFGTGA